MTSTPPTGKRRRATSASEKVVDSWYATATPLQRYLFANCLLAVSDDTWRDKYLVVPDFERKAIFHVYVTLEIVMTVRLYPDYPGYFSVLRVGDARHPLDPA